MKRLTAPMGWNSWDCYGAAVTEEIVRKNAEFIKITGAGLKESHPPDIAITKYRIAVFCDSDFWHGYDWENRHQKIKSNRDYWIPKIERNMQRDREVTASLESAGWTVLRFWEFQIKKELDSCVETICKTIEERRAG